jgi:hypothetical protein
MQCIWHAVVKLEQNQIDDDTTHRIVAALQKKSLRGPCISSDFLIQMAQPHVDSNPAQLAEDPSNRSLGATSQ